MLVLMCFVRISVQNRSKTEAARQEVLERFCEAFNAVWDRSTESWERSTDPGALTVLCQLRWPFDCQKNRLNATEEPLNATWKRWTPPEGVGTDLKRTASSLPAQQIRSGYLRDQQPSFSEDHLLIQINSKSELQPSSFSSQNLF